MRKMFYSYLFLVLCVYSIAICDENDRYDEYYFEKPDLIEWEGHLWQPYCLEHSDVCPCHEIKEDLYLID